MCLVPHTNTHTHTQHHYTGWKNDPWSYCVYHDTNAVHKYANVCIILHIYIHVTTQMISQFYNSEHTHKRAHIYTPHRLGMTFDLCCCDDVFIGEQKSPGVVFIGLSLGGRSHTHTHTNVCTCTHRMSFSHVQSFCFTRIHT